MSDRLYAVKAQAQDVMSAEKKNIFQDMIEADMVAKDFLQMTKDQFVFSVKGQNCEMNTQQLKRWINSNIVQFLARLPLDAAVQALELWAMAKRSSMIGYKETGLLIKVT
jgi:hypothetical protein